MSRGYWQQLAEDRRLDSAAMLTAGRWTAAYYMAGYVVECGLKSCILHHVERTGALFHDEKYLKQLAGCRTHNLDALLSLAGLTTDLGHACGVNSTLRGNWLIVKDWKETSRYEQRPESEARTLFEAVIQEPDGVLRWLRAHW